jgi:hypothetical protein
MRVSKAFLCATALLTVPAWAGSGKGADKGPVAKIAKPEGVKALTTIHAAADKGFVEDAYAFDGSGGRLAIVRADASSFAEVEVVDLSQNGASLAKFDISAFTTWVVKVEFVLDGSKLLVFGKTAGEERVAVALYDLTGKKLRELGPATDVALADVNGTPAIAVWDDITRADGHTYEIAVFKLADGKPLGKKRTLKADVDGFVKELDMRVLYWRGGYTQVVGLKKGAYDKTKDQRLNDSEAIYDVVEGKIIRNTAIKDLVDYTKLVKLRAEHPNQAQFLMLAADAKSLELVTKDDKRVLVATKELPFNHYDPGSLRWQQGRDGKIYFSLTIDPVNADAVAAKKADPEHIDLFMLDPATGKAARLARIPLSARPFSWSMVGGRWAVLRKHKGQGRGGPDLEIFELITSAK